MSIARPYELRDDGLPLGELAPGGLRDPCALGGAFFGPVPFMTITFALLRLFCNAIATPFIRKRRPRILPQGCLLFG